MKSNVMTNVSRAFSKVGIQLKKYSPEILLVTGIVGGVTSAVLACKATTKAGAIVEKAKENINTIHEVANNPAYAEQYSAEDSKKDLAIVYGQTALEFVKLYGPSVLLGVASVGCLLTSHNIVHKRNLALAAAYAAENLGFKEYRNRVIDRFGEELDKELKYNLKSKEVEEIVTNEDGTTSVVKHTVDVVEGPISSPYAFAFDETCVNWTRNAEDNKFFLIQVQNWANDRLKAKGHLFLNEVLDALGIDRTRMGQVVGWVYDKDNTIGDNFVDFGIFNLNSKESRRFVNGYEKSVWLDFNVDGDVMKLLK